MAFRCPSPADLLNATLALLPRGRAWQSNEGGPQQGYSPGFAPGAFGDGFSTDTRPQSVLLQYWQAVSEVFGYLTQRICDLRLEFWCASETETNDLWLKEYGLPDACDPFPDLCAKVAAIGGTRCEYYQFIAERAGWSLICADDLNLCGSRAGSGRALCGKSKPGQPLTAGYMSVIVDIPNSPAIAATFRNKSPMAGRTRSGRRFTCAADAADFSPLECLLARVVHAEIKIIYGVII